MKLFTLRGLLSQSAVATANELALLPPQQSNLSRHRAWSFAHSCSYACCPCPSKLQTLDWIDRNFVRSLTIPEKVSGPSDGDTGRSPQPCEPFGLRRHWCALPGCRKTCADYVGCSGAFLPPSPPAEKATG
jgi:hypothetical protein